MIDDRSSVVSVLGVFRKLERGVREGVNRGKEERAAAAEIGL